MNIKGFLRKDKEFRKKLIKIALPIALQNMSTAFLSIIDMIILGNLGDAPLAAVALSNQIAYVVSLIAFGVCGGGAILLSQFFGKKDYGGVFRTFKIMLLFSGAISFLITVIAQLFPAALMRFFTDDSDVIAYGVTYFKITAFTYILLGISTAFMALFRCMQKASYTLYAAIGLVFIKTVLNFYFIRVRGIGVAGAGYATAAARICEIAVYILFTLRSEEFILIVKSRLKITFDSVRQFIKVSLSVLVHEALCGFVVPIMSAIYGRMSLSTIVAMNICSTVQELFNCAAYGIAGACAIMIGREVGADNNEKAKIYAGKFGIAAFAGGICVSIFMLLIAKPYVSVFFKNIEPESTALAVYAISIIGLYMPLRYVSSTLNMGVLRAGSDAFRAMFYDCVPYYVLSVGLGFVLGIIYKQSLYVVMPVINLYMVARFVLILIRVKSKKWLNKVI